MPHFQAGCEAVGGCVWCFSGQGWQYQVLAGPGFIVMFTISGVIMGYLADRCVMCNSVTTLRIQAAYVRRFGFFPSYWELLV